MIDRQSPSRIPMDQIDGPQVVRFSPEDLGHLLGSEALRQLGVAGEFEADLKAVVENGAFQEIVVRVSPSGGGRR